MEGSIFISYRRGDGPGFAGRLYDRLEQEFSADRLFFDVDNIDPGLDFVEVLQNKVAACDVLLAIIGRGWAEARDGNGELRLQNPDDFVRIEIEQALTQGKRVIPVLVDGAEMPRRSDVPESLAPLLRRNAVRLSHEGFRSDVNRLVRALEDTLADLRPKPEETPKQPTERPAATPRREARAKPKPTEERAEAPKPKPAAKQAEPVRPDVPTQPAKTIDEVQEWLKQQREKDDAFKKARLKAAEEKAARDRAEDRVPPPPPPPIVTGAGAQVRTPPKDAPTQGAQKLMRDSANPETPPRAGITRRVVLGGAGLGAVAAAYLTRGSWLPGSSVREIAETAVAVSHGGPIGYATFDPTGHSFVTAGADGLLKFWSSSAAAEPRPMYGHSGKVNRVVYAPVGDRTRFVTASDDATGRIWNAANVALLQEGAPVRAAGWSRDATRVAIGGETMSLWDAASGSLVLRAASYSAPIADLTFASWGGMLATASEDGSAALLNAVGGWQLATLDGHRGPLFSIDISDRDAHVVTASRDMTARLWFWDGSTASTVQVFQHADSVVDARFSPGGGVRMVTASHDRTACLWDTYSSERIALLEGHEGALVSARFRIDGHRIVTAASDRTARLWDGVNGKPLAVFVGHGEPLAGARFSEDGRRVLTWAEGGNARVWNIPADLLAA